MATNFEVYKDKIMEIVETNNSIALSNGKPVDCITLGCGICDFREDCYKKRYKWLYAEHIEAQKLTKRERAFCEALQTGCIARDEDGELYWYSVTPLKVSRAWAAHGYVNISTFGLNFSFVKWKDENPWSIEDLLKLEVSNE